LFVSVISNKLHHQCGKMHSYQGLEIEMREIESSPIPNPCPSFLPITFCFFSYLICCFSFHFNCIFPFFALISIAYSSFVKRSKLPHQGPGQRCADCGRISPRIQIHRIFCRRGRTQILFRDEICRHGLTRILFCDECIFS